MVKVICGIIEKNGLVLITQRSHKMMHPLLWEFPGGKLEPGETEQECLVREISEELGISIKPNLRLQPATYTYPDKTIQLIPYTCAFISGSIHLLEHASHKWIKPNELEAHNWCPADIPIIEHYLHLLSS